jgi:hypothetical protein
MIYDTNYMMNITHNFTVHCTFSKTTKSVYKMTKIFTYYYIVNQTVDGIHLGKSVYRVQRVQ